MNIFSIRFYSLLSIFLLSSMAALGQQIEPRTFIKLDVPEQAEICILHPTENNAHYKFAPDITRQKHNSNAARNSSFLIDFKSDCNGEMWPEQAREAINYAATIWESHLESSVPIRIEANWVALNENVLGSARPTNLFALTGSGIYANTFYTIAQASALTGQDIVQEFDDIDYDIVVNMNCEFPNWYLGTDANTPSGKLDAVTVFLHEIGHGIGFFGSMFADQSAQTATWGYQTGRGDTYPMIFDQFTLAGSFRRLLNTNIFPRSSNDLFEALTGDVGGVYFSGPEAQFSNNYNRIQLYSPPTWSGGSSYSHLDQDTYGNTENALMRPQLDQASAIHSPGPIFCGLLDDMGWPLGSACMDLIPEEGFLDRPQIASPFNGELDNSTEPTLAWNPVEGASEYRIQLSRDFSFNNPLVNQVVSNNSYEVNQTLEFNSIYFWRVQALSPSGNSKFTSKFRFGTAQRPPDSITLFAPEDGTEQLFPGFQLSWQTDDRAEEYELQIAKNEDFSPLTFNRTLKDNRFSGTQNFDFSTTFYWRVRGVNSAGKGDWSETRSFTTIIEKPDPVTLDLPADDQSQVPVLATFSWLESERASEYLLQVSRDEDFAPGSYTELESSGENVSLNEPLDYATIYYWRVKASNIGGESDWSTPLQFTTIVQETAILPNYPNPFNASTTIRFELAQSSEVTMDIFNTVGRRVATIVKERRDPGVYFEQIQASGYASGTYFIRIVAGDFMDIQKMAIIK